MGTELTPTSPCRIGLMPSGSLYRGALELLQGHQAHASDSDWSTRRSCRLGSGCKCCTQWPELPKLS